MNSYLRLFSNSDLQRQLRGMQRLLRLRSVSSSSCFDWQLVTPVFIVAIWRTGCATEEQGHIDFDDMDRLLPWFLKTIYDTSAKFDRSLIRLQHENFYLIVLM